MKLPTATEYAIDLMAALAQANGKGCTTLRELCKTTGISVKYAESLMTRLSRAQMVTSFRGRHGGYRLAQDASKIKVLDIIEKIEGTLFPDRGECSEGTRKVNTILRETFQQSLKGWTLAKLI